MEARERALRGVKVSEGEMAYKKRAQGSDQRLSRNTSRIPRPSNRVIEKKHTFYLFSL